MSGAERFWVLRGDRNSAHDTEMLEDDPVNLGDAPRCRECGRFTGGKPWLPPHRAELTLHGSAWGDFAFRAGSEVDALVSERVVEAWNEAGLGGLSGFEPVEITGVRGSDRPPPRYAHVAVAPGGAAVDEARSSLVRSEEVACERCHYGGVLSAVGGFRVEPGTWTGEDIFIPRGLPGTVVVSERFRRCAESHGLTNVRLEPTEA